MIKTELSVYVDGSCKGNGKPNAKSGIGIYFGKKDPRNVSAFLKGKVHTNNIAELTAILVVLKIIYKTEDENNRNYIICTDSQYSISCVTQWIHKWKANGWKTADKKTVQNQELIQSIYEMLMKLKEVTFKHIKAHTNKNDEDSIGNRMADTLAVKSINQK
jgi:ribonuclease HI